jgi:hypothetical protein
VNVINWTSSWSKGKFVKQKNGDILFVYRPAIKIELDCDYEYMGEGVDDVELHLMPRAKHVIVRIPKTEFIKLNDEAEKYFDQFGKDVV